MSMEGDRWLVIDDLTANEPHHYTLHWLLNDVPFEVLKPPSLAKHPRGTAAGKVPSMGTPPGANKEENKNSLHLKYEARMYKVRTVKANSLWFVPTPIPHADGARAITVTKSLLFHCCSKPINLLFVFGRSLGFKATLRIYISTK